MKNTYLLIFLLATMVSFSQTRQERADKDLERLEELHNLVMENRITEFEAKKEIIDFYYKSKDYIGENASSYNKNKQFRVNEFLEEMWKLIQGDLDDEFLKSHPSHYKLYLYVHYETLKSYEYSIKDFVAYAKEKDISLLDLFSKSLELQIKHKEKYFAKSDVLLGYYPKY